MTEFTDADFEAIFNRPSLGDRARAAAEAAREQAERDFDDEYHQLVEEGRKFMREVLEMTPGEVAAAIPSQGQYKPDEPTAKFNLGEFLLRVRYQRKPMMFTFNGEKQNIGVELVVAFAVQKPGGTAWNEKIETLADIGEWLGG